MSNPSAHVQKSEKTTYVEVENKETGEKEKAPIKIPKLEIHVQSRYAVPPFIFSKSSKETSWTDSRDGKKVSFDFVKSEMSRIVGHAQMLTAIKELDLQ